MEEGVNDSWKTTGSAVHDLNKEVAREKRGRLRGQECNQKKNVEVGSSRGKLRGRGDIVKAHPHGDSQKKTREGCLLRTGGA